MIGLFTQGAALSEGGTTPHDFSIQVNFSELPPECKQSENMAGHEEECMN